MTANDDFGALAVSTLGEWRNIEKAVLGLLRAKRYKLKNIQEVQQSVQEKFCTVWSLINAGYAESVKACENGSISGIQRDIAYTFITRQKAEGRAVYRFLNSGLPVDPELVSSSLSGARMAAYNFEEQIQKEVKPTNKDLAISTFMTNTSSFMNASRNDFDRLERKVNDMTKIPSISQIKSSPLRNMDFTPSVEKGYICVSQGPDVVMGGRVLGVGKTFSTDNAVIMAALLSAKRSGNEDILVAVLTENQTTSMDDDEDSEELL